VGARFGIAHGRANAIFLPHVVRYNASLPSKFMPAPGYSAYIAPEKYAQIAWVLGLGGKTERDRRERLFARVDELLVEVDEPRTLADCGVDRQEFEAALPELAKAAFADPSIRTNPRIPMIREVIELLQPATARRLRESERPPPRPPARPRRRRARAPPWRPCSSRRPAAA
jgi:acetaldehyde dehydrogenase/alcohol dehydrogenase